MILFKDKDIFCSKKIINLLSNISLYSCILHYEKFADGSVKCIEDEIPFELPDGWAWSRLTSICSLISDIDHKMPKAVNDGVLFLSAKDLLNDGSINYTDDVKMISEEDFFRLSRKALPQKNDIIYSRIGACLGKARVVTKDIRFIVSYSCCTIRPVIIDSTFLASILDGDFVLDQAKEGTQSVGVPDLGMASIKQFLIPIPPLVEQQRIDERLQYALSVVHQISTDSNDLRLSVAQTKSKILDLAIRGKLVPQNPDDEPASVLLEHMRAQKEELIKAGKIKRDKKESVIFKGEDNSYYEKIGNGEIKCIDENIPFGIPESWCWCRLGTLFAHNTGKALNSADAVGTPMTYITTSNLYWDRFELNALKEMPFTESEIEKCTVTKGDLLVCEGGDIGRSAIWMLDEDIRIQNHIHRLRPYISLSNRFYYYVMFMWKQMGVVGGQGIGLQGFSSKALHNLLVPLPPVEEQVKIATFVDSLFETLVNIEKSLS